MRLTSFVVSRSWGSNRLRTALSVLGIALGVAVVTAIHVMDHNTIQSQLERNRADFGRVDFELVPHDVTRDPAAVRQGLAAHPEIRDVGILHPAECELAAGGRVLGAAAVFGLGPLPSRAFRHYALVAGDDLDELDGDGAVLISASLAAAHDLAVGAELELRQPTVRPRARCRGGRLVAEDEPVGGRVEPVRAAVRVKGVVADRNLARRAGGAVVIGSFALARRLAPGRHAFFQVNKFGGSDADALRQQLARDFQVLDERSALLGEAAEERAFRNGVKVLGCLALVLGMFVVFQTLAQSLVERLRQLGLLRALGASRRSVAAIFLVDAVGLAVAGVALGVGLGLLLAWVLKLLRFSTLGVGKEWLTFELPWRPILWTALLGLLFTVAGAAFPLWKARTLSAIRVLNARGLGGGAGDVLRGVNLFLFALLVLVLPGAYLAMTTMLSASDRETLIVLGQLGGMVLVFGALLLLVPGLVARLGAAVLWPLRPLLPLPVFLVHKTLERNLGRVAASVCGLAIVLVALVALKGITYALRGEAAQFGSSAMPGHQVFVRGQSVAVADAAALAELPGIESVGAFQGRTMAPFRVSGIAAGEVEHGPLRGRPERVAAYRASRGLVVSTRLAYLYALQEGGVVQLITDEGPVAYTVLAVADGAGFFPDEDDERAWACADPRWLHHDFCAPLGEADRLVLRLGPHADEAAVLAAVRERFPRLGWAKSSWWWIGYHGRDVTRDFLLFDVLLGLIVVLAGVGLLNAMTIAALARVREIGVLRALGVRRRQLRATFLIEGVLVGGIAALVACALGLPLGWVVVQGLNRVAGMDAPFVAPWAWVAAVPAIALAVGVLAAWLPGARAGRMSPAQAVRYE